MLGAGIQRVLLASSDGDFTDSQYNTMEEANVATAAISFVCDLVVIGIICWFQRWRDENQGYYFLKILALFTADFFQSGSMFWFGWRPTAGGACTTQAIFTQIFTTIECVVVCCIAHDVHMTTFRALKSEDDVEEESAEITVDPRKRACQWYVAINCALALIATLLPFIPYNTYGPAGVWCWITDDDSVGNVWRFATLYVPLWLIILYICYVYISMACYIYGKIHGENVQPATKETFYTIILQLAWYPIIMIVCWTPATVNRICNSAGVTSFGLYMTQVIFNNLIGAANSFAYGFTKGNLCPPKDDDDDDTDEFTDIEVTAPTAVQGNVSARVEGVL